MGKLLKGLAYVVGFLVVVGGILRLTVINVWTIPEDATLNVSLSPTLAEGDTVLLWTKGDPHFGQLVRCDDPKVKDQYVIGRIVGFGGDRVKVDQTGLVRVNGTLYQTADACPEEEYMVYHPTSGADLAVGCSRVEMGGQWHYLGRLANRRPLRETEAVVPDGHVYLLSDNRDYHDDSRDFGAVPYATCQETIFFRLWGLEGFSDPETRLTFIQ